MIRVLNFFCIAATAFTCLALNHVSDQTRVAQAQLRRTRADIFSASDTQKILEADWERAANPARIQALAAVHLGLADAATVQVASLELLPRRGESGASAAGEGPTAASVSAAITTPSLHLANVKTGE